MSNTSIFFLRVWRVVVLVLSLALVSYLLYFHRLGSLLPGYSAREVAAYTGAASWHNIAANPVNAPYEVVLWLTTAIAHHGLFMTRVVAASFGVIAALLFYLIVRTWHDTRVSFLSTILFASSAGLLHSARFGNGQILQASVLVFIACMLWYRHAYHRTFSGYILALVCALLWYVPGMLWFEIFGLLLLRSDVLRLLKKTANIHLAGWGVLFAVVVAPLVIAGASHPHVVFDAAGLPRSLNDLPHIGSNLLNAVMSIGVRSNADPLFWVGHTPLLNVAELILAALGIYYYVRSGRSPRALFLLGSAVVGVALISLGGAVGFVCLVPLLYLFVAGGLDHLTEQWLTVFPRNPIAKFTGLAVVCMMLFFSVLYQVRSYFIAWPHYAVTRQTFNQQQRRPNLVQ